jgi:hypothetical protein
LRVEKAWYLVYIREGGFEEVHMLYTVYLTATHVEEGYFMTITRPVQGIFSLLLVLAWNAEDAGIGLM